MQEKIKTYCQDGITLMCSDCMEYMRSLPDNAFNLAVVDPPYGNAGGGNSHWWLMEC